MPLPVFCSDGTAMELMRRARADFDDPTPRLVLADWLERRHEPDAHEMCQVLRASFARNDAVPLRQETASRLYPMCGARRGWFSGPWLGHGGGLERLWLASPRTVELPGGVPLELEYIPAGTFMMGSPETEQGRDTQEIQHPVSIIKAFFLGKYPVTQEQWQAVMGNNPSELKGIILPVENVSWFDVGSFCQKLNEINDGLFELPTEAEWEYACRAGTATAFHFGEHFDGSQANCNGGYPFNKMQQASMKQKTTPVGSYSANAWSLYDMHGNVSEWCSDSYGIRPNHSDLYHEGYQSGIDRTIRGGSWFDFASECRAAYRVWSAPDFYSDLIGFRLLMCVDV